jgi:microcystin-dependent protein
MDDPFIGEIQPFALEFAPKGWMICAGQLMSISQNSALFAVIGPRFGGDGKTTFALPNLQGTVPLHIGQGPGLSNRQIGEHGGVEAVALTPEAIASHRHAAACNSGKGNQYSATNHVWALDGGANAEYASQGNAQMAADALSPSGGGLPHNNIQPCLAINYCIAVQGEFPPRG